MLADDLVLAVEYLAVIQLRICARDSLCLGVLEIVPNVRRVKKSFGWYTADQQASAAQSGLPLDEGRFEAVLTSPYRCGIPARSAADNYCVVCHFRFDFSSQPYFSAVSARRFRLVAS